MLARDRESVFADLGNGEAVGQGRARFDPHRFPCFQGGRETGDMIGFDGDDFCFRPERFHGERDAREQTAAAHRHDDGVEIRDLGHDLKTGGALAGDDRGIVVAVDVGQALLRRDLVRPRFRFREIFPFEDDGGAEFLAVVDLDQGRKLRHHDRGRHA